MEKNIIIHRVKTVLGRAVLIVGILLCTGSVALTENVNYIRQQNTEEEICEAGLQFGMKSEHLPPECQAFSISRHTSASDHREKWQYRSGYLLFDNGILIAIGRLAR
jgi:hypothetical protein